MSQSSMDGYELSQLTYASQIEEPSPLSEADSELEYLQLHMAEVNNIEETTRRYYSMLNYYATILNYTHTVDSSNVTDFLAFLIEN